MLISRKMWENRFFLTKIIYERNHLKVKQVRDFKTYNIVHVYQWVVYNLFTFTISSLHMRSLETITAFSFWDKNETIVEITNNELSAKRTSTPQFRCRLTFIHYFCPTRHEFHFPQFCQLSRISSLVYSPRPTAVFHLLFRSRSIKRTLKSNAGRHLN